MPPLEISRSGKDSWRDAPLSAKVLVAANLVPVVGVLFGGWKITELLFLYWSESAVIGVFNVLKLALVSSGDKPLQNVAKVFAIPFFCVHYGMFMFVHGMFLGFMSVHFKLVEKGFSFDAFLWDARYALSALLVSHGLSFIAHYLPEERFRTGIEKLMRQPYSRIVVMHLTILLGFFGVMVLGQPSLLLLLFIGLKVFVDLRAHLAEHPSP